MTEHQADKIIDLLTSILEQLKLDSHTYKAKTSKK